MPLSGMTGFGRAEGQTRRLRWTWEARSVNGRGLDIKLRCPQGFDAVEAKARELASSLFQRGSLQATLTIAPLALAPAQRLDRTLMEALIAAAAPYVESGRVAPPTWDGLLQVKGVMRGEETEPLDDAARQAEEAELVEGARIAFAALAQARGAEGAQLQALLGALLETMERQVHAARGEAAAAPEAAFTRIKARLAQLAPDLGLDPQRLAQEAALLASRADTREELDRLAAHIGDARAVMAGGGGVGRRLDFLAQELTREANTLSAKSSELALTRIALDLKTAIDQFKEQAANVE